MSAQAADPSLFSQFAAALGANEPSLKLLLSLLIGYPLLLFHRSTLYRGSPALQHLFFIVCGLSIGIFNSGYDVVHSMVCVVVGWLMLVFMGGTLASVIAANCFQMGYLLVGYYVTATTTYDIKWTMPHCVLTLRLIALTWDMYDGAREKSSLSKEQAETAMTTRPSLLEMAAHTYFPASYMVGPQFSMKRYLDFVHGRLFSTQLPDSVSAGLTRGALGLFFVAIFQVSSSWLPDTYLVTDEFDAMPFASKCVYIALWGKITLYKYNACWLMAEGVLIISGIAYSGPEPLTGAPTWTGSRNVIVILHETAHTFKILVSSFNINTNGWLAKYVYKRMKFLDNRNMSTLSALLFLSLWHGFHSGYYACFALEFLVNYFEKSMERLLKRYPELTAQLDSPLIKPLRLVIMKIYVMVLFGYCLAPFVLLKSARWWRFFKSMYFLGHVFFGGIVVYGPLLKKALDAIYGAPRKPAEKTSSTATPAAAADDKVPVADKKQD